LVISYDEEDAHRAIGLASKLSNYIGSILEANRKIP
jgi:hypothetical protein